MVQQCPSGKKMRDLSSRFLMLRTLHAEFKIFTVRQADAFAVTAGHIKANRSALRQLAIYGVMLVS
jgi:hypothetical protein